MEQDVCVVIEYLRGQVTDISYVLLAAARQLAQGTGGKVIAILLGNKASSLTNDLAADQVIYAEHPSLEHFTSDGYLNALVQLVPPLHPRAVLMGHTSMGMDIAGGLSIKLGLPLVSSARQLGGDGKFTSQICGGKLMAEGDLPAPTALVTMIPGGYKTQQGQSATPPPVTTQSLTALGDLRVTVKNYIEPEGGDVDIAREPLLIAVGRGIQTQDNIVLADELAEALGGVVCASRPVIDQGWLPTSRLVGKSGKAVKPKIYLAIGISGAPEHAEAITGSDTIIAINTDPGAPIFNVAKYGTTADLFDLVPALTELVRQAKG